MRTSSIRCALTAAAITTLCVASAPAHADAPGTPNQPPPSLPPSEPPAGPMIQVEPPLQPAQPQAQPQQVPTYRAYQERRHKKGSSHWYGWQTLIVDGGSLIGGTVIAGAAPGTGLAIIIGGYLIGPPIVHFAHGQIGRGFGDFGIRVGAPLVLATLGYLVLHGSNRSDEIDVGGAVGLVLGFGIGVLGAIAVDAAALAYEPYDDDDEQGRARAVRRHALRPATIAPMIAPRTEGGVVFGLSGTHY